MKGVKPMACGVVSPLGNKAMWIHKATLTSVFQPSTSHQTMDTGLVH